MIGKKVPSVKLDSTLGKKIGLNQYKGKNVLVVFFCFCFSPICTLEFQDFAKHYKKFKKAGVELVGVSTDSTWAQRAWARLLKLPFPLLSDTGKLMSKKFGVLHKFGFANRAYVLVDRKGVIRHYFIEDSPLQWRNSLQLLKEIQKVMLD